MPLAHGQQQQGPQYSHRLSASAVHLLVAALLRAPCIMLTCCQEHHASSSTPFDSKPTHKAVVSSDQSCVHT